MRKNIKKCSVYLNIIGVSLIICALGMIVYNVITDYIAGNKAKVALSYLDDNFLNSEIYSDAIPKVKYDGIDYIGIISIEKLNIRLPVIANYSNEYLKIAPTLYSGNINNNDAIIIAHNYISHFKNLGNLNIGDRVSFEDMKKNIYNYEVIDKEEIYQDNSSKLYDGEWDLTLFTCKNTNMDYRTTIRLKKID